MTAAGLPSPLLSWLLRRYAEEHAPAWAGLDGDGTRVRAFGGDWARYGCEPRAGMDARGLHDVFCGLLPFDDTLELPAMQMREGVHADVLLLREGNARWLLLLDAGARVEAERAVQQAANERHLAQARQSRLLDRYVGREVAEMADQGQLRLHGEGERRRIATLFADVRGFTAFNERTAPEKVMRALNDYMEVMLSTVLAEGGVIDKIVGDGLMAVFGLRELPHDVAVAGWRAPRRIQEGVARRNARRATPGEAVLGVGAGLATGEAVLGILGSRRRRAFTAIGRHVNLAARLESAARAGEVLLDLESWRSLGDERPESALVRRVSAKGIGVVIARVWRVAVEHG